MRQLHQLVIVLLGWLVLSQAQAVGLGNISVLSKSGQPLVAEIAVLVTPQELTAFNEVSVSLAAPEVYQRLGIPLSGTTAQLQVRLIKNVKNEPVVRIQSDEVLQLSANEVFLDALIELRWSAGVVRRAYTLLVGDEAKVVVKSGDTLSDIATRLMPNLEDANIDQAMIALYRANPQAFAGGSIHRLMAGAELTLPSKAMVQSVPVREAHLLTQASDLAYRKGYANAATDNSEVLTGDRLRVGPADGLEGDATRRMEEILVQERALAEAKRKIIEIEKNIAELKALTERQEAKDKRQSSDFWQNNLGPWLLGVLTLIALLVLLRLSKRSTKEFEVPLEQDAAVEQSTARPQEVWSENTAKLFASIDLNLPRRSTEYLKGDVTPENLRVKLNLARAYITIEDFGAARKVLDEVLSVSSQIDPELTITAKSLVAEIDQRVG